MNGSLGQILVCYGLFLLLLQPFDVFLGAFVRIKAWGATNNSTIHLIHYVLCNVH